jgi:hypothetical protein
LRLQELAFTWVKFPLDAGTTLSQLGNTIQFCMSLARLYLFSLRLGVFGKEFAHIALRATSIKPNQALTMQRRPNNSFNPTAEVGPIQ